jgi:hypothetical protein
VRGRWCWASSADLATQRSLVFIGGPLVLLAGLHARLGEYLHARARRAPGGAADRAGAALRGGARRPIVAASRWRSISGLLGAGARLGSRGRARRARGLVLAGDFAWLGALAGLIEPAIAGCSAYAGRRFPEEHAIRQRAAAAGRAAGRRPRRRCTCMRRRWASGWRCCWRCRASSAWRPLQTQGPRATHAGLLLAPLVLALAVRWAAPRLYAGGFFAAVAWLAEAMRSLAGPPEPSPRPVWVARLASPTARLWTTQWLRLTSAPLLRLALLLGWGGYLLLRAQAPGAPAVAVGLGLAALWLLPLQTLARQRRRNAALLASLPLPARARAGRAGGLAAAMVAVPGLLAAALLLRWLALV